MRSPAGRLLFLLAIPAVAFQYWRTISGGGAHFLKTSSYRCMHLYQMISDAHQKTCRCTRSFIAAHCRVS